MNSFLYKVAEHYYNKYNSRISNIRFVFSSKRASIFFRHYLSTISSQPIFAPKTQTLNDFIISLQNKYEVLDNTGLLFELYESYINCIGDKNKVEGIDKFVFWANIILSDFNTIDLYKVDPKNLFHNIFSLKEMIDNQEHINEELKELLKSISQKYADIAQENSSEKENLRKNFIDFWNRLYPLYLTYNESLRKKGCTYEGAIYRMLAENRDLAIQHIRKDEHIVFVGLFQIVPTQRDILKAIKNHCHTEFCWDEASQVIIDDKHKAHTIMNENKKIFGQIEGQWKSEKKSFIPNNISVISCPGKVSQAKALNKIIQKINTKENTNNSINTAILLPDENLLIPAITSIPNEITNFNITIGYPLCRSSISLIINRWLSLIYSSKKISNKETFTTKDVISFFNIVDIKQIDKKTEYILEILSKKKQYIISTDELKDINNKFDERSVLLEKLTSNNTDIEIFLSNLSDLLNLFVQPMTDILKNAMDNNESTDITKVHTLELEFLYHYITTINRITTLVKENINIITNDAIDPHASLNMVIKLIGDIIQEKHIPFEGDPLRGTQIIGILESRNLDFENLYILSAEEGYISGRNMNNSLIPYHIRKAFGLPTQDEEDAVEAYIFYRLIGKANNLYLLHNQSIDSGKASEQSRFIKQLELLYNTPIKHYTLVPCAEPAHEPQIILSELCDIETEMQKFLAKDQKALSASGINTLVRCPICFYYNVIKGIYEEKDPSMIPQSNELGDIVHKTMQSILKKYENEKLIDPTDLEKWISNIEFLRQEIKKHYYKVLERIDNNTPSALDNIYIDICKEYIKSILIHDKTIIQSGSKLYYIKGEKSINGMFTFGDITIHLKGFIDRIDIVEDPNGNKTLRIVDYKTGADQIRCKWEDMFSPEKHPKAVFQTLLYCYMIHSCQDEEIKHLLYKNNGIKISPHIYSTKKIIQEPNDDDTTVIIKTDSEEFAVNDFVGQKVWHVEKELSINEHFENLIIEKLNPYFRVETISQTFDNRMSDHTNCNYCLLKL